MKNKKYFLVGITLLVFLAVVFLFLYCKKGNISVVKPILKNNEVSKVEDLSQENKSEDVNNSTNSGNKQTLKQASVEINDKFTTKANLYNSDNGVMLPLSTIEIISTLPDSIKEKVTQIADSNNIFMSKKIHDKLLLITDNPSNIRHCIEFVEISLANGHQQKTTLGYNDKMKDSDNDIWEYDDNTKQPTRHSKYNNDGDIEFVEVWNYDDNPMKYEMKDADGHVLSLRKETLDDGTDLRVEHLVYDKNGNIKVNVSTTYDGADIKRFTYYNADKPSDGGSVFAEYTDGLKTKETVYSNDLKVINTYTSEYKDGEREDIVIWDNNNNQIKKLIPADAAEVL